VSAGDVGHGVLHWFAAVVAEDVGFELAQLLGHFHLRFHEFLVKGLELGDSFFGLQLLLFQLLSLLPLCLQPPLVLFSLFCQFVELIIQILLLLLELLAFLTYIRAALALECFHGRIQVFELFFALP
jgi:hypothetical protein